MNAFPSMHRRVVLAGRPVGIPQAEHFRIEEVPVLAPGPGEILVRNEFLSVEPAMRGWVNAAANYSEPVAVGDVMRAFAAGTVCASRNASYREGDRVMGLFGWQEYAIAGQRSVRRIVRETDLPLSLSLGVLGINGITAWFALNEIGQPRPGDVLVVSTAAGAVGSAAGQIGALAGCRTIGITRGESKLRLCREVYGYASAVDYSSRGFADELATATAGGVDIYYDNTSGSISDTVLPRINRGARIVICGTASIASWDDRPSGPRVERHLLTKAARMQGFLVWDYEHRYEEAVGRLAGLVRSGSLRYREEFMDGIEQAPGAIAHLYRGDNLGKLLIRLRDQRIPATTSV